LFVLLGSLIKTSKVWRIRYAFGLLKRAFPGLSFLKEEFAPAERARTNDDARFPHLFLREKEF